MADFKISGHMKVKTLKELFANEIGGTLRVYNGKKLADDDATLASIRSNEGAKGGDFTCRTSRTVGKFEQEIWDVYGIKVQVATADNWILVLDGITLSKVKDIPNYATKESMEEFVSYKRKAKNVEDNNIDEFTSNNTVEESSELKQFTIKITSKGAHAIEHFIIDTDEYDPEYITADDAEYIAQYESIYVCEAGLSDDWNGSFQLEVYDEKDELVYSTQDFNDIQKVSSMDYMEVVEGMHEDGKIDLDEDMWAKVQKAIEDKEEDDKSMIMTGPCILVIHEAKWRCAEYKIKDIEFDPNSLMFVLNPRLEAANFDYYTDENHVLYKDEFLCNINDDMGGDEYNHKYYVAEMTKHGTSMTRYWFENIKEL